MNFKKQLLIIPVVTVLSANALVFANTTNTNGMTDQPSVESNLQQIGKYSFYEGIITNISNNQDEGHIITVQRYDHYESDEVVRFIITENTAFLMDGNLVSAEDLTEGMVIAGHYYNLQATRAMLPLTIEATFINVVQREKGEPGDLRDQRHVVVDVFDEYMVSSDKNYKLQLSEDTKIVNVNNEPYENSLHNKRLAVVFANNEIQYPEKVIVLGAYEGNLNNNVTTLPAPAPAPGVNNNNNNLSTTHIPGIIW